MISTTVMQIEFISDVSNVLLLAHIGVMVSGKASRPASNCQWSEKEKLGIPEPILFDLWLENKFTQA